MDISKLINSSSIEANIYELTLMKQITQMSKHWVECWKKRKGIDKNKKE